MERERLRATLAGVVLAGVAFAVMLAVLDAGAVLAAARRGDPGLLALVAGMILLWNASWGMVFWNVLRAVGVEASAGDAVLINAAGAFANHVTPFGQAGGEPVTAWLTSRSTDTDYEVSLAAVASFDAINVAPSLAIASVGWLYYLSTPNSVLAPGPRTLASLAVATVAVALLGVWLARRTGRRPGQVVATVVRGIARRLPWVPAPDRRAVLERVASFRSAVGRVARDRRRLVAAVAFSTAGWLLQGLALWVALYALGTSVPVYVPVFVVPFGTLGSVLPTPGGLGGTEAINVALLSVATAADPATIGAAVLIHSVGGYLLTTTAGAAATGVIGARNPADATGHR